MLSTIKIKTFFSLVSFLFDNIKMMTQTKTNWAKYNLGDKIITSDLYLFNLNGIETFSEIAELSVIKCRLELIDELVYLINLRKLTLSTNNISHIEPIRDLIYLEMVDFNRNKINDIKPLAKLINLRILSLSDNQIEDVSILSKLTRLTYLKISKNRIKLIESFYGLTNLISLDISFNQIKEIQFENLTKLNILDIENNFIQNVESIFNLNLITHLNCSDNNINYINFRRFNKLQELFAMNNNISNIDSISVATGIEKLYLSSNQIENVKSIESLKKIKDLILNNNKIKSINFKKFEHLELVDLSNNLLTDIESLSGLEFLKKVNFSNNKIESNTNKSMISSSKIYQIDLRNNCLTSFIFNSKIKRFVLLDLSFNRLKSLTITNYFQVVYLYLNDNLLSDISQLNNVSCSNILDISNNNFEIDNLSKTRVFSLMRKVNLSENPIKNLSGIENLSQLKMIYLSSNQIDLFQNIINSRVKELRKEFYESLFINSIQTIIYDDNFCEKIIYLLKKNNLHLNLCSPEQIDYFLKNCPLSST